VLFQEPECKSSSVSQDLQFYIFLWSCICRCTCTVSRMMDLTVSEETSLKLSPHKIHMLSDICQNSTIAIACVQNAVTHSCHRRLLDCVCVSTHNSPAHTIKRARIAYTNNGLEIKLQNNHICCVYNLNFRKFVFLIIYRL